MKCIHVDAEGFCGNKKLQGGGFKCCHCSAFTPDKQSTMKNNKSKVVEAEVVEVTPETGKTPVAPVVSASRGGRDGTEIVAAQNRDGIVKTIARQIEAVRGAELRSTFEKLKLGAMVKQAVTLLGLDSKGGRGRVGDGVKGWWDENFKGADGQPVIKYTTLMNWISAAEKLPSLIGGSASADPDGVMKLLAKDPEKVVGRDAKILKSAEKVANGMTMRQMLLWGGDDDVRKGRQGGANKGQSGTGRRALTVEEQAKSAADEFRELIGSLHAYVVEQKKVALLTAEEQEEFIGNLKLITRSAEEMVG